MKSLDTKKIIHGWAMYDWANSAYNLVITSTIFPIYYSSVTIKKIDGKEIDDILFLGMHFKSAVLYNYAIAFAYLVICLLSPILSSIADNRGNKQSFLRFFTYLGGLACCLLYFFTEARISTGIIGCILGAIGYCGALVFYNAYLPEIASPAMRDRVSAKGFAYGYIGSVLLQIICFYFILTTPFGLSMGDASRLSFLLVGLWWMGFAQMTFNRLPMNKSIANNSKEHILFKGFHSLSIVWQEVKKMPVLKNYLIAFFFYSMGVQTVILAATIFGKQEMKLSEAKLIACILIIQLIAIAGAFLMAKLSSLFGNVKVLMFVVFLWIAICVAAYFITQEYQFFLIAFWVGLVMGGIQALSRSTYAKIMPETKDTASYFSFYDVTEKLAIVLGLFSFGYVQALTGSMRNSIIALALFFTIGLVFLGRTLWLKKEK